MRYAPSARSYAARLKAAAIAHAIFGGLRLSHAGALYIYDAQTYFNTLIVESALDGRDLFEKGGAP